MSERDALIERVKRQAKLPYNRLCSEVRFFGGPIIETGYRIVQEVRRVYLIPYDYNPDG